MPAQDQPVVTLKTSPVAFMRETAAIVQQSGGTVRKSAVRWVTRGLTAHGIHMQAPAIIERQGCIDASRYRGQFLFGGTVQVRPTKFKTCQQTARFGEYHPVVDQRRPGQQIGQALGLAAKFFQEHGQSPKVRGEANGVAALL